MEGCLQQKPLLVHLVSVNGSVVQFVSQGLSPKLRHYSKHTDHAQVKSSSVLHNRIQWHQNADCELLIQCFQFQLCQAHKLHTSQFRNLWVGFYYYWLSEFWLVCRSRYYSTGICVHVSTYRDWEGLCVSESDLWTLNNAHLNSMKTLN